MLPSLAQILGVAILAQHALASQVCTPEGCVKGKSTSNILHVNSISHDQLTPGTYPLSTSSTSPSFSSPLNQSTSKGTDSSTLNFPSLPFAFPGHAYRGLPNSFSGISWTADGWESLYLPQGWYAVVGDAQVLWGPIADSGQLPGGIQKRVKKASSTACDPPCSSNGICVPGNTTSTAVSCTCRPGWTGAQCDQCAKGYYGSTCKQCQGECTVFDDGLSGSGKCLGTAKDASTCNCIHGTCTASGDCTCSAGYTTNTTISDKKCNTCIQGFFQTSSGDCRSCPAGCTDCRLKTGTTDISICTTCRPGLGLDTADPARCALRGNCQDGQYWDNSTSTCGMCSPACSTCSGLSPSDCLTCAPPRMNLEGKCVGLDNRGVCDTTLASVQGVFVANNGLGKCDACPSGCASCYIPSFSSFAPFNSLLCTACADGYLLEEGKCVKRCSAGWFLPEGSAERNGACQRCSSSCAECQTSSNYCTRCPSSNSLSNATFALLGSCSPTCPSGTIAINGTCTPCHPDCSTCSSPSFSSCTACPPSSPCLQSGRCLDHCPKSSYFDTSSKSCLACGWTCSSCAGPGGGECTSCSDGYILEKGQCKAANCGQGGFVHGAGLCLGDLIDEKDKRWVAGVFLPIMVLLLGGGVGWYIRKQRKRTREETKAFKTAMDNHGPESHSARRKRQLGLERLWGFDRVWPSLAGREKGDGGDVERGQTDKKRLRQLLLPSLTRPKPDGPTRDSIGLTHSKYLDHLSEIKSDTNRFSIPPPPYAPSTSTSGLPSPSATSIDFSSPQPDFVDISGPVPASTKEQLLRSIKRHEDDIDLLSQSEVVRGDAGLDVRLPSLPPVAGKSAWADKQEERERQVYRPMTGKNQVEQEETQRVGRLSDLWPNLKDKKGKVEEGWI